MLTKRIIPCLDVKDGIVVKGTQFKNLQEEGDPVELAVRYEDEGADELIFLDISASHEKRATMINIVQKVAQSISIPFTVGGGIKTINDIQNVLCSGADKVSINSAAVRNPSLITAAAEIFGSQCIVVAIDARRKKSQSTNESEDIAWEIFLEGGRIATGIDAISWGIKVKELGAGELLPTSMDCDGMKNGYDLALNRQLSETTNLPIIASGGAGTLEHLYEVFVQGKADAALAASIFHREQYSIQEVKEYLQEKGIQMRIS